MGGSRHSASIARGAAKVETQPAPASSSSRSTYRLRPAAEVSKEWKSASVPVSRTHTPVEEDTDDDDDFQLESQPQSKAPDLAVPDSAQVDLRVHTPPLTPAVSPSPKSCTFTFPKLIPESPYNPLLTPSFRHSPARLPSEQPWRFPSPSHPLHSSAREMSLSLLAQAESSPIVRGLDVSPLLLVPKSERKKQSIFSSPISIPQCDTTDRLKAKPTPKRLFADSMAPTPFSDRLKFQKHRNSPLAMGFTPVKRNIISLLTPSTGAWSTSFSPSKPLGKGFGLMGPIELASDDPFADELYKPWLATPDSAEDRSASPPDSSPEVESPVLRASQLSQSDSSFADSSLGSIDSALDGTRKGLKLMEGFSLKDRVRIPSTADDSDEDDVMLTDVSKNTSGPSSGPRVFVAGDGSPLPAVLAGRKTRRELFFQESPRSGEGDREEHGNFHPKKRRRTVSGFRN